jgi:predicted ATPase
VSNFIGRQADLDALEGALVHEQLVTIVGPPGIGKTRIAKRCVEARDGAAAWLCDLTETTGVDEICHAVSRALDIPLGQDGSVAGVEQLGMALAARGPLLLVLDNFESVVAHAPATVGRWLRQAPEARFLVTSRERLRLAEEVVFDLGPLTVPDDDRDVGAFEAVQLFVARAHAVRRSYALTEEEAPRVAALVRLLDGNPLAIELAAARMRVLTTVDLLESLPRSLDVFAGNTTDASRRHLTLRDAVAWSWSGLSQCEQAALAQCAVFRGGFDMQAAQEVLDLSAFPGAPLPIDVIQALHDKSLLFRYEPPEQRERARFRLYVGVRELATEKLAERGDVEATEARHSRYFLARGRVWAAAVDSPSALDALRTLAAETENLLTVHRRALRRAPRSTEAMTEAIEATLALEGMLFLRGPHPLLLGLLDSVLDGPRISEVAASLHAAALHARGKVHRDGGRAARAQLDLDRALALAEGASEANLVGEICVTLIRTHADCGRVADAEACFARAIAVGDRRVQGRAHARLPVLRWRQGRCKEAIALLEEALRLHREVGDLVWAEERAANLALMKAEIGRLDEACVDVAPACASLNALGFRKSWAIYSGDWGIFEHARGRFEAAKPLYEQALLACREIGIPWHNAWISVYRGLLDDAMGRPSEARVRIEQALPALNGSGEPEEALALAALAALDASTGRVEEARAGFAAAELRTFHWVQVPAIFWVMRGHLDLALARAALAAGDPAAEHEMSARRRATCAPGTVESSRHETAEAPAPVWLGLDVRIAQKSLQQALARHDEEPRTPPRAARLRDEDRAPATLALSRIGNWLRWRGGERVSAPGKLCRVLRILAVHQQRAPGAPLPIDDLIALGWPGEKMHLEAGTKRVYTAIWHLRRLGLKDAIFRVDGGYLLDPAIRVELVDEMNEHRHAELC